MWRPYLFVGVGDLDSTFVGEYETDRSITVGHDEEWSMTFEQARCIANALNQYEQENK